MANKRDVPLSSVGEFGLIGSVRRKAPRLRHTVRGIGDDAAVLKISAGCYLLFTTDMLVEDVHFDRRMDMKAVGWKSLCCSISDIAAMGGVPRHALISLGVPVKTSVTLVNKIYDGIFAAAREYGVDIVGGDTVKSGEIVINIALTGEARKGRAVYRSGAKTGDRIFVTGPLGNSFKSGWHLRFMPRVAEARYLSKKLSPSAMIDVSDGLAADLGHILEESNAGAVLDAEQIPLRQGATLKNALHDGEDFELVFTLRPRDADTLLKTKEFNFYLIGEIIDKRRGFMLRDKDGKTHKITPAGFKHF